MSNRFGNIVTAELSKLRTLPIVPVTITLTALGTVLMAVVLAANSLRQPGGVPSTAALDTGLHAVTYGQIGLIVLGIVTAASEYSGGQIRTTLVCVPNRTLLLAGKTVAYLTVAVVTALLAVATSAVAAQVTLGEHGVPVSQFCTKRNTAALFGATAYLALIGLLAFGAAILIRNLVGALGTMLTLVFVASPILTTVRPLDEYLPDQAGSRMYQAATALTPAQGAAVLAAWIAGTLTAGAITFAKRDA